MRKLLLILFLWPTLSKAQDSKNNVTVIVCAVSSIIHTPQGDKFSVILKSGNQYKKATLDSVSNYAANPGNPLQEQFLPDDTFTLDSATWKNIPDTTPPPYKGFYKDKDGEDVIVYAADSKVDTIDKVPYIKCVLFNGTEYKWRYFTLNESPSVGQFLYVRKVEFEDYLASAPRHLTNEYNVISQDDYDDIYIMPDGSIIPYMDEDE